MGVMRFPSLRVIRSSFSLESRRKDKKIRNVEIVEWDGEGGFNISLPGDKRLGSLEKVNSGISHFRRIVSLGRSGSKTTSHKRREDHSEDSRNVTECPKGSSQESVSMMHHLYEYPTDAYEQEEVARLVLSRLMSYDDAVSKPVPKNRDRSDIDCNQAVVVEVEHDRYGVPAFSNSGDDSVTLNTLHHRINSFEDTVFDGIVDDTFAVDTHVDATNQDEPSPRTYAHCHFPSKGIREACTERFWPSIVIACFRMPTVKKTTPFTPGSGTVVWDDTVILSALSY
jgi:hypothetical protein